MKEDKISKFLEIDEFINSKDYKEEKIVIIQYPLSQNLKISSGKILCRKDNLFLYDVGTDGGSSGFPLILLDKLKIIGMHKGGYYSGNNKNKKNKVNIGIPLSLIINKINFIKEDTGNDIEIEKQLKRDFLKFENIEEIDIGLKEAEKNIAKQNGFILIGAMVQEKLI